MPRAIPRIEATEDLFLRARALGVDAPSGADDHADGSAAAARNWRSLRWRRLEGIDLEAKIPPPLLPLPADAAFDVAEPEPEDEPPSPHDLEEALSEAVDLSDEWATTVALAGGTHVAQCLPDLLDAMDWHGSARQVAEVLPALNAPLDGSGAARVLGALGYRCRAFRARLDELGPQDFPALFVTKDGNALVLRTFGQQSIPGFDGASRTRRPVARDRRAGWAFVFTADDALATDVPVPPAEPLALLWTVLKTRFRSLAVSSLVQGMLALAGPLMVLIALDHAVPSGSLPMILFFGGMAAFAILAEIPFRAWRDNRVTSVVGMPVQIALGCLARTLFLSPQALRQASPGSRRARFDDFHVGGGAPISRLALAVLGLPAALIALFAIAVLGKELVAVPVAGAVIMAGAAWVFRGGLRVATGAAIRTAGGLSQRWMDTGRVVDTVLSGGSEDAAAGRLERAAVEAARTADAAASRVRTASAVFRWIAAVTVAGTAVLGAYLVQGDALSQGALGASILLSWGALSAFARLACETGNTARIWCGLDQARRLHAIAPERASARPSVTPRVLAGHVDVSVISTAPEGRVEMPLDGVSLYADPGDVVAVVGDYQSGKSALLRVLAGLQPTTAGHVRLDGVETVLFDPMQLRQSVAYVPETPEFLPLTIEQNLRLMHPAASDAQIQDACQLAGVMDELRVLETGVGANRRFGSAVEMGVFTREPHPGFFKRLALARGYLRRSGLVLLDGPERHLDPEGEQAFLRAIEELRGEATIIIATDRPQIIRLADRVLWLEGGRTRADGPSASILQQLYEEGRVGQTLAEP